MSDEVSLSMDELNDKFKDFVLKGEYVGQYDSTATLKIFAKDDRLLLDMTNGKGSCLLVVEIKETLIGNNEHNDVYKTEEYLNEI